MSRVQDIVYELEDQLTPLAAQSEAAKEFLALKRIDGNGCQFDRRENQKTRDSWQSAKTDFDELSATTEEKAVLSSRQKYN